MSAFGYHSPMVRVLLVDDHSVVRKGVRSILDKHKPAFKGR